MFWFCSPSHASCSGWNLARNTHFLPSFRWCNFFCWWLLGSKVTPQKQISQKWSPSAQPDFSPISAAQQMEMAIRKSTFQGFWQVYIVGWARHRKPFKKIKPFFLPEMAIDVNTQGDSIVASLAGCCQGEKLKSEEDWTSLKINTPKIKKLLFSHKWFV